MADSLNKSVVADSVITSDGISRISDPKDETTCGLLDAVKVVCGRAVYIKSKATSRNTMPLNGGTDCRNASAKEIDEYLSTALDKMLYSNLRQVSAESRSMLTSSQCSFKKRKDLSSNKDLKLDDLRLEALNQNVSLSEGAAKERQLFVGGLEQLEAWRDRKAALGATYQRLSATSYTPQPKTQESIKRNRWKTSVLQEISRSLLAGVSEVNFLEDQQIQNILCNASIR